MAHRFMNIMRKYAKVVLAIMGVVCMVTFVVGPYLLDLLTGGPSQRASESPVVVTWAKGKLRESDLANLRNQHVVVYRFLYNVIREAADRGGTPVVNGQSIQKGREIFSVGIPNDFSDEGLVETMLMAEEAKRMGIVVNQTAVKDYLRQLSSPELNEGDWREIAEQVLPEGGYMTVGQLLTEFLPYQLQAQHARELAHAGLRAIPPGELWNYFNRLNRRVSIEAYPVEVAPLVNEVKAEPSAAEIQKLFDEGKYRDPNPMLLDAGFRKPHKVAFAYLRVDFKPFLEEAKKQITDQQIEEQYQKDIAQGLHKVPEPPAEPKKEEEKKDDAKAGDDPEKKGEDKKGDEKKEGEEKPSEGKKADETPPAKIGEAPGDGCQAEPAADAKAGQAKADDEKSKDDKKADEKPKDDKPADEKPKDEKPAEEKKEPKFKPLAEVREEILTKLAQPIAQEVRTKAAKEAVDAINAYGRQYRRWQSVKEFKKDAAQEPAKLDLEAIAAKHGFKAGTTPLVDQYQVGEYEIGKEVMTFDIEAARMGSFRMQSFADIAFVENEATFDAKEATSTVPDVSYIYFRTAEEKPADVKLDEVRQQVIEAWKRGRAFEAALAEGQKLADKAKGKTLAEVVGDPTKIITPPPFSWMTTGAMAMGFGQPELSRVAGIDLAGREFMEGVFALKLNAAGVAPNQPHTRVYVVRLLGEDPAEDILRQQFLDTGLNFQVLGIAHGEMNQLISEWFDEVEKRYGVTWHRPPRDSGRGMM